MRERWASMTPAQKTIKNWTTRAKPAMPRPGSRRAKDPRNIAIALAYCVWSDIEEVIRIHIAAAVMTELTGEQYRVDHVIPIVNPFVCGLHTHTNMQVITERENQVKSNTFWPGMGALTWEHFQFLCGAC